MTSRATVESRLQLIFLLLILSQGVHSVEEYATKLYAVFPPARFVSTLVSSDTAEGFVAVNAGLVAFGFWCWLGPMRSASASASALAWFWTILELANGAGHIALALLRRGYFPGVITAPLLLFFAGWEAVLLARRCRQPS